MNPFDFPVERARDRLAAAVTNRIVAAGEAERVGEGGRIFHVSLDTLPISSSQIRDRAAAGESLDGLVPWSVAQYIRRTGLYRRRTSAE